MMKTKIVWSAALALLMLLWGGVAASAAENKICDLAGLLTDQEEEALSQKAQQLTDQYAMDVVAVLIDDNEGKSSMEYADDFFDENGYGVGSDYSGILLLVDMDDRVVWISTSGQGIAYFTDRRIDQMTAQIGPHLTEEEYAEGVEAFLEMVQRFLAEPAPGEPVYDAVRPVQEKVQEKNYLRLAGVAALCGLGAGALTVGGMVAAHGLRPPKTTEAYQYANGALRLSVKRDSYLRRNISKSARSTSSSSGSRGSSTHRSSSGRSHGGGGRSF